ncbi:hypothetical protein Tco_0954909 [Tanacetum coccineum]|uniref:Uncharacterized protein n=1 Tax=Tanacetum coccineum TaxID=301880 RepID=A0ABQ5E5T4_9ASTR
MAEHFAQADIEKMEQPVMISVSSCRVSKYKGTEPNIRKLPQSSSANSHMKTLSKENLVIESNESADGNRIQTRYKPVKNQEQSHKEKETSNAEKEVTETGTPPESAIAVAQPVKNPEQHERGKEKTAKRSLLSTAPTTPRT